MPACYWLSASFTSVEGAQMTCCEVVEVRNLADADGIPCPKAENLLSILNGSYAATLTADAAAQTVIAASLATKHENSHYNIVSDTLYPFVYCSWRMLGTKLPASSP
jgi:hypothetical protein